MNMLLCHYLIPKEFGDSKVLFSKLQLATYIYSIHYIFPFEFILGYIVRRLVIIIIILIINNQVLRKTKIAVKILSRKGRI